MTFNSKSHNRISLRQAGVLLSVYLLACSNLCTADETQFEFDGHTKTRLVAQTFPDDSIFHELTGSTALMWRQTCALISMSIMGRGRSTPPISYSHCMGTASNIRVEFNRVRAFLSIASRKTIGGCST